MVNNNDLDLLFDWANDPDVRKNSIHTSVISYEEHQGWFREKMLSTNSDLFIYCKENENIGHIRLDYKLNTAIINFSIDKNYRGKGHGTNMLKLAERIIRENKNDITCLEAVVKKNNLPSQMSFLKLDYNIDEKRIDSEYIYFYKYL